MRGTLLLLAIILLSSSVAAFGVSPASTTLTNPEGESVTLRIINQEPTNAQLRVTVEDEHGFLSTNTNSLTLQQNIRETQLIVTANNPIGILPGTYTPAILIEQLPPPDSQELVVATQAIRHRFTILVPADGFFLDANIISGAGAAQSPMTVGVLARNVGTENIIAADIDLTITDPQQNVLHTYTSDSYRILSSEQRRFETRWTPPTQGEYTVQATVRYDGQELFLSETITVGTLNLVLGELGTGPYSYGDILRLDIPVQSEWNRPLRNVYADIQIQRSGAPVDSFVTPRVDVSALGQATLEGFWNTQGVAFGAYDIVVTAQYGGKTTERTYSLVIGADSVRMTREVPGLSWQMSLFLLLAALTLVFVMIRKLAKQA